MKSYTYICLIATALVVSGCMTSQEAEPVSTEVPYNKSVVAQIAEADSVMEKQTASVNISRGVPPGLKECEPGQTCSLDVAAFEVSTSSERHVYEASLEAGNYTMVVTFSYGSWWNFPCSPRACKVKIGNNDFPYDVMEFPSRLEWEKKCFCDTPIFEVRVVVTEPTTMHLWKEYS